jgi:hypothetical protein
MHSGFVKLYDKARRRLVELVYCRNVYRLQLAGLLILNSWPPTKVDYSA